MNSSSTISPPSRSPAGRPALVALRVADADLQADVRAVLAALGLEAAPEGAMAVDVLVTDAPAGVVGSEAAESGTVFPGVAPGVVDGSARVVRVCADGAGPSDGAIPLPTGLPALLAALDRPVRGGGGAVLAVLGAVGGCGASTVAAALAVRSGALLVEADPLGPGIDLLLGIEASPGLRLDDVRTGLGDPDAAALREATPLAAASPVLARARGGGRVAAEEVVATAGSVARAHRSTGCPVVLDAGRASGAPGGLGTGGTAVVDLVVLMTRADLAGAVSAARVVRELDRPAVLVVGGRTGRGSLEPADVAASAGMRSWHALPWRMAVARTTAEGRLAEGVRSARLGALAQLSALADRLLEEGGVDVLR